VFILLIFTLYVVLAARVKQLDVEDEGGVGRDAASFRFAVREARRNDKTAHAADLHPRNTFDPSLYQAALYQFECNRAAAGERIVAGNRRAVAQEEPVVDRDTVVQLNRFAGALAQIGDLEFARRGVY